MTVPAPFASNCPNCGAPIRFHWAQAVQTTCAYCLAVLVRRDLDLSLIGKQADFPQTGSPIQLGTEGSWRGQSFQVVGRIAYQWTRGRWNEWHCRMGEGHSAWLSDAQLEYAMTVEADPQRPLPDVRAVKVGELFTWNDITYEVASLTAASYLGTEGELPFTTVGRGEGLFVDLMNEQGFLATIDSADFPPTLYLGEYVDFTALSFKNLREFERW